MQENAYDFTEALVDDVKGMKIGIPRDYFGEGLDPEVKEADFKSGQSTGRKRCDCGRI